MLDSSRIRFRALALAAISAAAIGLAACGDDDDDDASPTTTESATTGLETTETTDEETTTEDSTAEEDSSETDVPAVDGDGDVADDLRAQLEAAGVKSDQAECVIDELEGSLTEETLQDLQEGGQPSDELIEASTQASQKCLSP